MLQSVAHTPEGRIDAHAGLFSDLLEALLFPVAKAHDLLLLSGELAQAVAQLIDIFAVDQALLSDSVGCGDLDRLQEIFGRSPLDRLLLTTRALTAEVVHDQVVRDAPDPAAELPLSRVAALANGHHDLDEGILEDIFHEIFVSDPVADRRMYIGIVAKKKRIKGFVSPSGIKVHQLIIAHAFISSHCCLSLGLDPQGASTRRRGGLWPRTSDRLNYFQICKACSIGDYLLLRNE